jgi:TDG/mug DNA glycosylase family protein
MSPAEHSFPFFLPKDAEILILGSFPSVKSREAGFYYAHPQNRFFPLLARIYEEKTPEGTKERQAFLARHHIALYDVIERCDIVGSSDASITHVVPTDLSHLPQSIRTIVLNGALADRLFHRYQSAPAGVEVVALPSTSPANAAFSLTKLYSFYAPVLLRKGRGAETFSSARPNGSLKD